MQEHRPEGLALGASGVAGQSSCRASCVQGHAMECASGACVSTLEVGKQTREAPQAKTHSRFYHACCDMPDISLNSQGSQGLALTQRPPLRPSIAHQTPKRPPFLPRPPHTHAHTQTKDNPKAPSSWVLVTRPRRVGHSSAACSACGRARHGSGSATWVGHTEDPHTHQRGGGRAGHHPHCCPTNRGRAAAR